MRSKPTADVAMRDDTAGCPVDDFLLLAAVVAPPADWAARLPTVRRSMRSVNIASEFGIHTVSLTDCQQTRLLFPRLAAHNGCLLARARTLFAMKGI